MTNPINPIHSSSSSDSAIRQPDDLKTFSTLKPFIVAFSNRLNELSLSIESLDANPTFLETKVMLENYFSTLYSLQYDLGWVLTLLDFSSQPSTTNHDQLSTHYLSDLKQCYMNLQSITSLSITNQLSELQMTISSMDMYGQLMDHRQELWNTMYPTPSAPPLEPNSSLPEPSAPPLESLSFDDISRYNIQFLEDTTISPPILPSPVTPSIPFSSLKHCLALSQLLGSEDTSDICIECPVSLETYSTGDSMTLLYNSQLFPTPESLISNPDIKHYCFSPDTADYILDQQLPHPVTREPVDSMLTVTIDQSAKNQPSYNNPDFKSLHSICIDQCQSLASHFNDMITEIIPLQHELTTLLTYAQGGQGSITYDHNELSITSLKQRLKNMKMYYLALQYNQDGVAQDIGYSDALRDVMNSTLLFESRLNTTQRALNQSSIEVHIDSIQSFCKELHQLIQTKHGAPHVQDDLRSDMSESYERSMSILNSLNLLLAELKASLNQLQLHSQKTSAEEQLRRCLECDIQIIEQKISRHAV